MCIWAKNMVKQTGYRNQQKIKNEQINLAKFPNKATINWPKKTKVLKNIWQRSPNKINNFNKQQSRETKLENIKRWCWKKKANKKQTPTQNENNTVLNRAVNHHLSKQNLEKKEPLLAITSSTI